jgi:YHS domain-containing protein
MRSALASLAVLAVVLAACAEPDKSATPPAAAPAPTKPAAAAPAPAAPAAPAAAAPAAPAGHELKKITPSANYPLKTCVVSGEELGAMGDRVAYSYDGTEVQFCCPDCINDFVKDPAKYLAKLQTTAAK